MVMLIVLSCSTVSMDLFLETIQVIKYGREEPPTASAVCRF